MNSNNAIILLPVFPVFNIAEGDCFPHLSTEYSIRLYKALYLNFLEIFRKLTSSYYVIPVFDTSDFEYIDNDYKSIIDSYSPLFIHLSDCEDLLNRIENIHNQYTNITIIKTDSFGFRYHDILSFSNLLDFDNKNTILNMSFNNILTSISFNEFSDSLLLNFVNNTYDLDGFLVNNLKDCESFIILSKCGYSVKNTEDLKTLYRVLSNKSNYSLCSIKIHEMLTDIFIEYKDLLK